MFNEFSMDLLELVNLRSKGNTSVYYNKMFDFLIKHNVFERKEFIISEIKNDLIHLLKHFEEIEEYEKWQDKLDLPLVNTHVYDGKYLMPDEYYSLDIHDHVRSLCKTDEELSRVNDELMLFELSGEIDFIKYMKYLVDTMNSMNLVWGVGRGSSISVYIFYLLGVHKVDCIKYDISYDDFFKIKE
jgi:DNA polymerase III alpha subunit